MSQKCTAVHLTVLEIQRQKWSGGSFYPPLAGIRVKQALMSTPILVAPCDGGQYVLDTDASDTALGAVLQQEQGGKLHVIGYASRTLSPSEARYCITRRELLGVVFGLKKFRQYLLGPSIIVRTDNAGFRRMLKICQGSIMLPWHILSIRLNQLVSKVDG